MPGEVSLHREAGKVHVVLTPKAGAPLSVDLATPDGTGPAFARALALAVESLRDTASEPAPPAPPETKRAPTTAPSPEELPPLPLHRRRVIPSAKPTIFARLLLGISPLRGTPIVGPGAGFGLCVGPHCVVLEGDLSVLPTERVGQTGEKIRYRSVNAGLRAQIRPWQWGPVSAGFTLGVLTRIGRAVLVGTGVSRTVSNLGLRGTLEVAWRFATPFEWVFELGADYAITRAEFISRAGTTLLEDRWTPWLVTGLRLRP